MAPAGTTSTATRTSKGSKVAAKEASASESQPDAKHDFFWTYTEEPHRTRRLAIIKKHPEVGTDCYIGYVETR